MREPHSGHAEHAPQVSTAFEANTGRKIRTAALGVAVVLALAFAAVSLIKARQRSALDSEAMAEARRPPSVVVAPVSVAPGDPRLSLPGATAAWLESTIYSRVNGYVASWRADIGDHVRKGQVLAEIDTPELDAQLEAARAKLNAAQAQVRLREAEAHFATTTYERWRDSPKGVVAEQEREAKKADFEAAEARLNSARAQVALDQAEVDNIAAVTQYKRVVAPFDGTVVERRIDVGDLVTAGSTSSTVPLYRVVEDRPIRVFVDVPQTVAADLLHSSLEAEVRANAFPNQVFRGKVARTSQAINPRARTLKVEVDLPNAEGTLIPGMYVDVSFGLGNDGLPRVPAAALIFRAGGPQVAVVGADGRVRFRNVTIARDDGNEVELGSGSGVANGDKVALNISSLIADGDRVAIKESVDSRSHPGLASAKSDGTAPH